MLPVRIINFLLGFVVGVLACSTVSCLLIFVTIAQSLYDVGWDSFWATVIVIIIFAVCFYVGLTLG